MTTKSDTKPEFFKIVKPEAEFFKKAEIPKMSLHDAVKELLKHIPEYLENASFQNEISPDEFVTITITRCKKEIK